MTIRRQTFPGAGGLVTEQTKGRNVRHAPSWDQVVADLGLPNLTRHGLRHTDATWLADTGVPLHVLQEILGHASIETTAATSTPMTATSPPRQNKPTPSSAETLVRAH